MTRCLELARSARDAGETAVGSIVVRDGEVIGEGVEATKGQLDHSAHAELEAIRAACQREGSLHLTGATLYTTVEPCLLCGFAIRAAKISRVVIGTEAGEIGAVHGSYPFLTDGELTTLGEPPEVLSGVMADEARAILKRG